MERAGNKQYVIGICTSESSIYGIRLAAELLSRGNRVLLLLQDEAMLSDVLETTDMGGWTKQLLGKYPETCQVVNLKDGETTLCKESLSLDSMIMMSASVDEMEQIANGKKGNTIVELAKICLRQRRNLLLIPGQMVLTKNNLMMMLVLAEKNVKILSAVPDLDKRMRTFEDMIEHIVKEVLENLGV